MEALVLSCATGGGHHAAAQAMCEELESRGHRADFLDPYTLYGSDLDARVGNCYVKCAQRLPGLFGGIYRIGNLYRRLPGKSPVFWANHRSADYLQAYLERHSYDVILITHLFSGEILTHLRRRGVSLPKIFFISTDYTCIPFTEEIDCDFFVIPSPALKQEYCLWGIAPEKLLPMGIPVRQAFREKTGREKALEHLGLNPGCRYLLMAGGSIGAGKILDAVSVLRPYLRDHEDTRLIVICGTNDKLYEKAKRKFREEPQILLIQRTDCMAEYLKACDLYISKPGGLSSTEAAVANIPLIHISPIPGCETENQKFFSERGMSIGVKDLKKELPQAILRLTDGEAAGRMKNAQREGIDPFAAEKIAAFVEDRWREPAERSESRNLLLNSGMVYCPGQKGP